MYRLYIVDDDPIIRTGLSQNIDWVQAGVEVAGTTSNGRKVLEMMQQLPPDVVITDINMARMDGIELTDHIRRLYPRARVILLSGHSKFHYAQSAVSLQVLDYVLKPADNSLLPQKMQQAIRQIEQEQNTEAFLETNLPVIRIQFLNQLADGLLTDPRRDGTRAHLSARRRFPFAAGYPAALRRSGGSAEPPGRSREGEGTTMEIVLPAVLGGSV